MFLINKIENSMDFLGKGWSFPPTFLSAFGSIDMVEGREDINQSLHIILSTSFGERVMRPNFGCNLKDFQFEPLNIGFLTYLQDVVTTALIYHEPRIRVDNISIKTDDQLEGKLLITVDYTIKTSNSRFNFVYDYYLKGETAFI